jgi:hypothetical protein
MTGAFLGLAALDALYLAAGLGLLVGFGHVRSLRTGLRLAGLAFVVGWAVAGIAAVLMLVAGLSLAPWQLALACTLIAAAGAGAALVVPRVAEPAPVPAGRAWPLALLAAAVVVLYVEELGRRAFTTGATYHQDAWGFWLPKAKVIALFGGLDTGPGGVTSFSHADYPVLVPALDAAAFRFMGGLHASLLPVQEWLLAAGFLAALAGLLARRVPPAVLWPCLALVALAPAFGRWIGIALADTPLALLFALAGVAVAVWLRDAHPGHVALAATLLAAAAMTKVEGRSLGLVLAATATLASLRELRQRWPGLVVLAAVPVLAVLPWSRWLDAHHVPLTPDYRLGDAFHAHYLLDRTDRLETAIRALPDYLVGGDGWLLVLPLALAAAALLVRRAPGLAVLLGVTPILVLAGLVLVYWISVVPVEHYVTTSAERAVLSPLLFAASLLPLALAKLLEQPDLDDRSEQPHRVSQQRSEAPGNPTVRRHEDCGSPTRREDARELGPQRPEPGA